MLRLGRTFIFVASTALLTAALGTTPASAQRGRGGEPPRHPPAAAQRPRPVDRTRVVFIGGYFYDPFFGPYPWCARGAYPYFYYPEYFDARAVVRIAGEPDKTADAASVYVDGFYAGVVEDFDGFFEGLPLAPGDHEIVLYMEGYRTVRQRLHLSAASAFTLHYSPERLPAGVTSELPVVATPVPAPPDGTYLPPVTMRPAPSEARPAATTGVAQGTLVLRVQPADAEVRIDGEPWATSEPGRFVVLVAPGPHLIEVARIGYQTYSAEVRVANDEPSHVNVALTRERR